MCVGGSSILGVIILLAKWAFNRFASIDLIPLGFLLMLGIALMCLGWVKALQEMQFYEAMEAEKFEEVSDKKRKIK
jgi:hypothetical protein